MYPIFRQTQFFTGRCALRWIDKKQLCEAMATGFTGQPWPRHGNTAKPFLEATKAAKRLSRIPLLGQCLNMFK